MNGFRTITADDTIEWTRRFIQFPSEQGAAMEREPAVQAFVQDCVGSLIKKLGLPHRRDALGNLIVEIGSAGASCDVAFFTYAMTHPRAAMSEPFGAQMLHTEGGAALRGRGVAEQKAALAASLAALADYHAMAATPRPMAWVLLASGETGQHDAIASAVADLTRRPRLGIIAVGTRGQLSLGNRGRLDVELTIRGKACHSSVPWLGFDVVPGIRETLTRMQQLQSGLRKHPRLGPATLTCTAIRTEPTAPHTIQSEAVLSFDRRLLPGEDPQSVFQTLTDALVVEPPLTASARRGPFMYSHEVDAEAQCVRAIKAALRRAGVHEPAIHWSSGALDAGYLQHIGIPAVMWGPGDPVCFHTDEEHVDVAALLTMAESYRAVIEHLPPPI